MLIRQNAKLSPYPFSPRVLAFAALVRKIGDVV